MSIQSRSADLLRVEETFRKAMGELFSRLDESNRRLDESNRWLDESNRRRDQANRRCDHTDPLDPASAMVETRSGDERHLEEMLTAAMTDLSAKMSDADRRREDLDRHRDQTDAARDLHFKELRDEFLALQTQPNDLMTRFLAAGGVAGGGVGGVAGGGFGGVAGGGSGGVVGGGVGGVAGGGQARAPYFSTRQSKVGFPIFSGKDLAGWISRCDHFFTVDLTPEDSKVRLAVINFEGRALHWLQHWSQSQDNAMATSWILFLQALEGCFGDHSLGDPMTELLSLKQTGSFSDFHDRFRLLLGRVTLSETDAIGLFINGLRPCVQPAVRLFMPRTLAHTYALARLQEELSSSTREGFSPVSQKPSFGDSKVSTVNTTPLLPAPIFNVSSRQLLTPEEMADCFDCDEKFDRGHQCVRKQLLRLELGKDVVEGEISECGEAAAGASTECREATEGEGSEYGKATEEGNIGDEAMKDDNPLISINAISGLTTKVKSVRVDVAEMCDDMCTATTFTTDVLPLPVGNCDMVLGVQWPETLGDTQGNFKLRGGQKEQRNSTVSEKEMDKLLTHCNGVQLCGIQVNEEGKSELWDMMNSEEGETETPKCILERVRTDHKTLAHLMEQKLTTPGQLSWLSKLMAFDFDITYKKRAENSVADALSRGPSSEIFCVAITSVSTDLYPLIAATGNADAQLQTLIQEIQQDSMKNSKFSWVGGQLKGKGRLVVGDDATLREGDICQGFKFDNNAYLGLLILGFIKGFPLSHGKSTILAVGDRLTKYVHPMSLAHTYTALSVAQAPLDYVFKLQGSSTDLISDRDKVFLSSSWSDFFKFQGVELHLSTAYHPQSDGQTEVVNRCLETYLGCMCGDQPNDWSKQLGLAEFWYNTSFHSATETTPFEALNGYFPPVLYFRGESTVHDVNESLMTRDATLGPCSTYQTLRARFM